MKRIFLTLSIIILCTSCMTSRYPDFNRTYSKETKKIIKENKKKQKEIKKAVNGGPTKGTFNWIK